MRVEDALLWDHVLRRLRIRAAAFMPLSRVETCRFKPEGRKVVCKDASMHIRSDVTTKCFETSRTKCSIKDKKTHLP